MREKWSKETEKGCEGINDCTLIFTGSLQSCHGLLEKLPSIASWQVFTKGSRWFGNSPKTQELRRACVEALSPERLDGSTPTARTLMDIVEGCRQSLPAFRPEREQDSVLREGYRVWGVSTELSPYHGTSYHVNVRHAHQLRLGFGLA